MAALGFSPTVVLVGTPLVGRDAALVKGWAECVDRVARASPGFVFLRRAVVREGDRPAADACAAADVAVSWIPWYEVPPGAHAKNHAGLTLGRIRLASLAAREGASVLWYLNIDVRVGAEHWAAADALIGRGRGIICIPYPARWAEKHIPVVFLTQAGPLGATAQPHDARTLSPEPSKTGEIRIAGGGGFGCTLMLTPLAAMAAFVVQDYLLAKAEVGNELGWFVNAARRGLEVYAPAGIVAGHVGCEIEGP